MTEQHMIAIFCGIVLVAIPKLIALLLHRLFGDIAFEKLRNLFWSLAASIAGTMLLLLVLNPGRSGDATLKLIGNGIGWLIAMLLIAAIVVGRMAARAKARQGNQ